MKSYLCYIFRRFIKQKQIRRILLLAALAVFVMYTVNLGFAHESSFEAKITEALDSKNRQLKQYDNTDISDGTDAAATVSAVREEIKEYQSVLGHYENNDYTEAYTDYLAILSRQKEIIEQSPVPGKGSLIAETEKDIAFYEILADLDIPSDSERAPVSGTVFMIQCSENLFPYLLLVLNCFVLSWLFTSGSFEKINRERVLPVSYAGICICQILIGILVCAASFIIAHLCSFTIAALCRGAGSLQYPVLSANGTEWSCRPAIEILTPSFAMYMLSSLMTVLSVRFTAIWIHESSPVMIISLFVLSAGMLMPEYTVFLNNYVHWMPTTYIRTMSVITGEMAAMHFNPFVTYMQGIRVLSLTVCILLLFNALSIYFIHRFRS